MDELKNKRFIIFGAFEEYLLKVNGADNALHGRWRDMSPDEITALIQYHQGVFERILHDRFEKNRLAEASADTKLTPEMMDKPRK